MPQQFHHRWPVVSGYASPPEPASSHGFFVRTALDDPAVRPARRTLEYVLADNPELTVYQNTEIEEPASQPVLVAVTGHLHWRPDVNRSILLQGWPRLLLQSESFHSSDHLPEPDAIHLGLHLADGRILSVPTPILLTRRDGSSLRWDPPSDPHDIVIARGQTIDPEVLATLVADAYAPAGILGHPHGDAYLRYRAKALEIARQRVLPPHDALTANLEDAIRRGLADTAYASLPVGTEAHITLTSRTIPGTPHAVTDIRINRIDTSAK